MEIHSFNSAAYSFISGAPVISRRDDSYGPEELLAPGLEDPDVGNM